MLGAIDFIVDMLATKLMWDNGYDLWAIISVSVIGLSVLLQTGSAASASKNRTTV